MVPVVQFRVKGGRTTPPRWSRLWYRLSAAVWIQREDESKAAIRRFLHAAVAEAVAGAFYDVA